MIDEVVQRATTLNRERARLIYGLDVREALRLLPDKSVHMIATSPPYWGQRDYDADGQIGQEPTWQEYLTHLAEVGAELARVLRPDGTFWLNLGDKFYGKRLLLLPARAALRLSDEGWWVRQEIIWAKGNPMPGSQTDRPTTAHEMIYLLTRQDSYFYDEWGWREPPPQTTRKGGTAPYTANGSATHGIGSTTIHQANPFGRTALSVWQVNVQPYPAAHFATFPLELPSRMIALGTSEQGCCPRCGAPWVRSVEKTQVPDPAAGKNAMRGAGHNRGGSGAANREGRVFLRTLGVRSTFHPGCTCPPHEPVPCTVLDPFSGSATTGEAALDAGQNYIGLDLNENYRDLAVMRLRKERPVPAPATSAQGGGQDPEERNVIMDLFGGEP